MSAEPLSFVLWKWTPAPNYRSQFNAHHVNVAASMITRNYAKPHRIICVTDDAEGIDRSIGIVPLWPDHAHLQSPHGPLNPSCYRRLKMYSKEARDWFGPRFVSLDLDCVITGDLVPLFDRPDDIRLWGDTALNTFYNGGLVLMDAGCRSQVWETFDPLTSPARSKASGQFGSDQGWIGFCLGPNEKKFTTADGVYSFRNHIRPLRMALPSNARIIFYHGKCDPWSPEAQRIPWVREHWRI
jgi:hypothetical protein